MKIYLTQKLKDNIRLIRNNTTISSGVLRDIFRDLSRGEINETQLNKIERHFSDLQKMSSYFQKINSPLRLLLGSPKLEIAETIKGIRTAAMQLKYGVDSPEVNNEVQELLDKVDKESPELDLSEVNEKNLDFYKASPLCKEINREAPNFTVEGVSHEQSKEIQLTKILELCHHNQQLFKLFLACGNQNMNFFPKMTGLQSHVKVAHETPQLKKMSGDQTWSLENGKLVCTINSTFKTVDAMTNDGITTYYYEKGKAVGTTDNEKMEQVTKEKKREPLLTSTYRVRLDIDNGKVKPIVECLMYESLASNVQTENPKEFSAAPKGSTNQEKPVMEGAGQVKRH